MAAFDDLKREQLEASVRPFRALDDLGRPAQGWIRTVRDGLGMSIRQLAERIGLSKSSVAALEKREITDGITLESLRRVADGLESDLWYAIVPRHPVDEVIQARAEELARGIVEELRGQMEFEMREIPEEEIRSMIAHHTRKALQAQHRLWDGGRPQPEDRLARARRILGLDDDGG